MYFEASCSRVSLVTARVVANVGLESSMGQLMSLQVPLGNKA